MPFMYSGNARSLRNRLEDPCGLTSRTPYPGPHGPPKLFTNSARAAADDLRAPIDRSRRTIERLQAQLALANETAAAAAAASAQAANAAADAAALLTGRSVSIQAAWTRRTSRTYAAGASETESIAVGGPSGAPIEAKEASSEATALRVAAADSTETGETLATVTSLQAAPSAYSGPDMPFWHRRDLDSTPPGAASAARADVPQGRDRPPTSSESPALDSAESQAPSGPPTRGSEVPPPSAGGGGMGIFSVLMAARLVARAKRHVGFWSAENQGALHCALSPAPDSEVLFARKNFHIPLARSHQFWTPCHLRRWRSCCERTSDTLPLAPRRT